jgi:hypothetical protein
MIRDIIIQISLQIALRPWSNKLQMPLNTTSGLSFLKEVQLEPNNDTLMQSSIVAQRKGRIADTTKMADSRHLKRRKQILARGGV